MPASPSRRESWCRAEDCADRSSCSLHHSLQYSLGLIAGTLADDRNRRLMPLQTMLAAHEQRLTRWSLRRRRLLRADLVQILHQRVDHLVDAEARRALAWRIFLERLQERSHPPNAVLKEIRVLRQPVVILVRDDIGTLIRIHPQIKHLRCSQTGKRVGPHFEAARPALLAEHDLPVTIAIGDHLAVIVKVVEITAG